MLDIIYTIYAFCYDFYRLKGFFMWVNGTSLFGLIVNIYGLAHTFPKYFYAFTYISLILFILTLAANIFQMYLTGWGKDPQSSSLKERKNKKIISLACLFASLLGFLLNFILFICYCATKFKKSFFDILLFWILDAWVALCCYYSIIAKLIKYEMQSMEEIRKEKERRDKDGLGDLDQSGENKKEENAEVLVFNNNVNSKENFNEQTKK